MWVHCITLGLQAREFRHGQVIGRHLSGESIVLHALHCYFRTQFYNDILQANTSVRTNGGYTPLHIAAQHNHQEVFDLLVGAYKADANVRDYAGKKPRHYMNVQVQLVRLGFLVRIIHYTSGS